MTDYPQFDDHTNVADRLDEKGFPADLEDLEGPRNLSEALQRIREHVDKFESRCVQGTGLKNGDLATVLAKNIGDALDDLHEFLE